MVEKQKYQIVFMGTPTFAVSILERVAAWEKGEIICVYTQPDKAANRNHKITESEVKKWALAHNLPISQPKRLRDEEEIARFAQLKPDFLIVAAYGQIIPKAILDVPNYPPLNVHGSLLPKYRGAAPVQRAIMENFEPEAKTGVSIMQMVQALDAGPVFATQTIKIGEMTADALFEEMSHVGSELLCTVMDDLIAGRAHAQLQDESLATYAAKLEKSDGQIQWNAPAAKVHAQIRGVTSKPGAHTTLAFSDTLSMDVVLGPGAIGEECQGIMPGTLFRNNTQLMIACEDRWYILKSIKPKGKKNMDIKAYLNGYAKNIESGTCGSCAYLNLSKEIV